MSYSPMMQHYLQIKEEYSDCFVFYRLGDFYEMFFDDAKRGSELLDLTLTGRDCGTEERAPMCGVPYHAADSYIAKLVAMGEKVAICEQLEDPADAKGIVARDVIRVVTAGTVTDDGQLDEKNNNYVSCAYQSDEGCSVAWADITTGEFSCTEFSGDDAVKDAVSHMVKLSVKEIICNERMRHSCRDLPEISRGILPRPSAYSEWAFNRSSAEECLKRQFNAKTLDAFPVSGHVDAICAAGALIGYLNDTQKKSLVNIDGVRYVVSDGYMTLDNTAIRNLELTKSLGEGKKYGSLLWLLDKTQTAMGARMLSSMVVSPLCDAHAINRRLDGVEELYDSTVVRLSISELLRQIKDIERLTGKIANGNLTPRDCIALASSLEVIPNIKFQLSGFTSDIIRGISEDLVDMSSVTETINRAIVPENTPVSVKDGGFVREGYSTELDELRSIKKDSTRILSDMETRERDATGIKTLKINYNRVFGYYIEVTKSLLDRVPERYERRQTLTNCERFVTPELKDLEEKILSCEEKSLKLETEIFEEIKQTLAGKISDFKRISSAVALLDVTVSLAEVAKSNRFVRPEIKPSDEPLVITEGRHPVVEAVSNEKFIPNDTLMDEDENRTLIITGPNMAGKSTYMRQTALIVLMAHIGSFVPAKSASIPLTDRIFTRIGASDNLVMDRSTFMTEMIEVASILQNATKHSLLILDEVGRGTSTYDGLSIAWAVIEHITENIGAKTMFATHYHELTDLENTMRGVKNYKIAVKEINGGIVFLRKIMRGGANRSFGIEVASLAGVPRAVTDRAKKILKAIEKGGDRLTADLDYASAGDAAEMSEVEKILSETDMNSVSPMQAFLILGDLVEKVKK